jgi:hypothetical protein
MQPCSVSLQEGAMHIREGCSDARHGVQGNVDECVVFSMHSGGGASQRAE